MTYAEVCYQNEEMLLDRGKNQTPSAICAAFTSACSHSGFPPVSLLTDVLRIRFCHLKAHWGDTPQTFYRVKRGVPWWYIEKQE